VNIRNPILPGFNPDPSIVRVGDDYYIATSTFEWYPGVQIHHSRDLVNWRLLTRPLNRASQLDMRGDPDSCGIWALGELRRRRGLVDNAADRLGHRHGFLLLDPANAHGDRWFHSPTTRPVARQRKN